MTTIPSNHNVLGETLKKTYNHASNLLSLPQTSLLLDLRLIQ